ncbi:MAG: hypothetical protein RR334_00640 [Clostridia bacterium]
MEEEILKMKIRKANDCPTLEVCQESFDAIREAVARKLEIATTISKQDYKDIEMKLLQLANNRKAELLRFKEYNTCIDDFINKYFTLLQGCGIGDLIEHNKKLYKQYLINKGIESQLN